MAGFGGRVLKATTNATGDWRLGKLQVARGCNHVVIGTTPYTVELAETYTYGGKQGRVSKRDTATFVNGGAGASFTQSWTWNDLGNRASTTYPKCTHSGCTASAVSLGFETQALCPTREFLEGDRRNCLWLAVDDTWTAQDLARTQEKLTPGTYVMVDGKVSCEDRGFGDLYGASLHQITWIVANATGEVLREAGAAGGTRGSERNHESVGPPKIATPELWQELVEEGEGHFSRGAHRRALELFEEADRLDLFEVPNYEAFHRIAEARCLLREVEEGLELLEGFRCMLAVDRGELPCYVGPEARTAPGESNPALSELCSERMCGEMYLSYYESPSEGQSGQIEELAREAKGVEALCRDLAP